MKKIVILLTLVFVFSIYCFAQTKPNYSGEWILELDKSKIDLGTQFPAMTKTIKQTANEIEILDDEFAVKLIKNNSQPIIYSLDGKEVVKEFETSTNKVFISNKSGFNKENNFEIIQTRKNENQVDEVSLREVWELVDEGETLKVTIFLSNSLSEPISETVFSRQDKVQKTKKSSDAIVNGKALRLITPPYPPEAKKEKAEGAVGVKALIDEKGNVVLAKAIAGHPTLLKVSEEAARLCKFSPTKIEGVPVKVTGIIVYKFSRP